MQKKKLVVNNVDMDVNMESNIVDMNINVTTSVADVNVNRRNQLILTLLILMKYVLLIEK